MIRKSGVYGVQVGNDQEKDQSKRISHSKNRGGKNQIDDQVLTQRKLIISRKSSYFLIGGHSDN